MQILRLQAPRWQLDSSVFLSRLSCFENTFCRNNYFILVYVLLINIRISLVERSG